MNIRDILLLCCGGGVVCFGGMFLAVSFVFRRFAAGGLLLSGISSAFGMVRGLIGGGNDEEDLSEPMKRLNEHERVDPQSIRLNVKQSLDFDSQVAQKLNQESADNFTVQSSSPPKPKNKPSKSENTQGDLPPSYFGKREFGARERFSGDEDDPLGDGGVTDKSKRADDGSVDLGPINLPSDRRIGGRMRRDRRQNRQDAGEDEIFGGYLDGDGDGFPDL